MSMMDDDDDGQLIKLNRHSLELDLDLDYLDRPTVSCLSHPQPLHLTPGTGSMSIGSPDDQQMVRLVLLGAPSVGKTSIIQQFVWNTFSATYSSTSCRHTYYPTVIVNRRVYELKITDLPAHELPDGLKDATAYLMILDLTEPATFHYLETVRRQIAECRDIRAVPLMVVGNKVDLFDGENEGQVCWRRVVMDRAKTDWACHYVDCSARLGSTVCHVFRSLLETLDPDPDGTLACPSVIDYTLSGAKCSLL